MFVFLAAKCQGRPDDERGRLGPFHLVFGRRKHGGASLFTPAHVPGEDGQVTWGPGIGTEAQVQTLHPRPAPVSGSWVAPGQLPL